MKRQNNNGFALLQGMIFCAIAATIAIVTMALMSPVQPAFTLETLCIDHVRFVVGPDGYIRQMLNQVQQGVACDE